MLFICHCEIASTAQQKKRHDVFFRVVVVHRTGDNSLNVLVFIPLTTVATIFYYTAFGVGLGDGVQYMEMVH